MAYYDALAAAWQAGTLPAGASGTPFAQGWTTAQKFAAMSGWTLPGPKQDVPIGSVVSYLALQGKLYGLKLYVAANASGTSQAVVAANEFLTLVSTPSVTSFAMGEPAVYSAVQNFLDALAGDGNSGITAGDVANILALAATTLPWATAPVASGGAGLSTFTMQDVVNADLT